MKSDKTRHTTAADTSAAVDALIADLDHPLKSEIESVRHIILKADGSILEGVKWNSLSFRTADYFATVHLRSRDAVQLIFHLGAKVRPDVSKVEIADPAGLAKWLGKDRCLVNLGRGKEFKARQSALTEFVQAWIRHV
ncbi:DUF1801 domain-containing protein [Oleiharenicola lentus]|uniref:DUF1801 domain-containing protein n=1 Tax=Oleiharenicola lentus TaxID=2508720 RepID=UPI003F662B20